METGFLLADEKDKYSLLVFQNHAFLRLNHRKKNLIKIMEFVFYRKSSNTIIEICNKSVSIFLQFPELQCPLNPDLIPKSDPVCQEPGVIE